MKKFLLVGHFSSHEKNLSESSSPAGNQVQRRILSELLLLYGESVSCYSMQPVPSWPRASIFQRSKKEGCVDFIGFINIYGIKHISFSIRLLSRLINEKFDICLQYNSYIFENIALLVARIAARAKLGIIIQDVNIHANAPFTLKGMLRDITQRWSISLARHFDAIAAVSYELIDDFRFDREKCIVFRGGLTDFAEELLRRNCEDLECIGLFAGSLEPYNGVDRLIRAWMKEQIPYTLHVFGRGSSEDVVRNLVKDSFTVVFHGFVNEDTILEWQGRALWNFCLRYNDGIHESYFFPSKLFNIMCAPGHTIINKFHGIPDNLSKWGLKIDNDLSGLRRILEETTTFNIESDAESRRLYIREHHAWKSCVAGLLNIIGYPCRQ